MNLISGIVERMKKAFKQNKETKVNNSDYKDAKITVESEGQVLTLTLSWEGDIWAWAEAFRTILFWMTFHPTTINRAVKSPEMEDECCCDCEEDEKIND